MHRFGLRLPYNTLYAVTRAGVQTCDGTLCSVRCGTRSWGTEALLCVHRFGLRRLFDVVADAGNNDAFVALCLLTVCGTSIATELIGFGQTLGAFLAGVLLAETSFRPQVRPRHPL